MNRREFLKAVLMVSAVTVIPTVPGYASEPDLLERMYDIIIQAAMDGELSWPKAAEVLSRLQEPGPHWELIRALEVE
jgi:hypothetical protein